MTARRSTCSYSPQSQVRIFLFAAQRRSPRIQSYRKVVLHTFVQLIPVSVETRSSSNRGPWWTSLFATTNSSRCFAVRISSAPIHHPLLRDKGKPTPMKRRNYTIWGYPHDPDQKHLKAIEKKWEAGGFLLGPIWILIKGGPPLLALMALATAAIPLIVFGVKTLPIIWALLLWTVNANCHSALQGIRLKATGHVHLGDVSAISHEDAQAQFKNQTA